MGGEHNCFRGVIASVVDLPESGDETIPEEGILIIGAGHFGVRAARILCKEKESPIIVIDVDEGNLSDLVDLPVTRILYDGIRYLVEKYETLKGSHLIVPACPLHLACEWLEARLRPSWEFRRIEIPKGILGLLPNPIEGGEGSLLVSYADFICPDDCFEPQYCTVTGEKRDVPMYKVIEGLDQNGFGVHVIRSQQLGPGVGGYYLADLTKMEYRLTKSGISKWFVATSCRCHGIISALDMRSV